MNQLSFENKTNKELHITVELIGESFALKKGDWLKLETQEEDLIFEYSTENNVHITLNHSVSYKAFIMQNGHNQWILQSDMSNF
tara:strand:- start:226 stop:477 length:252 start_codon:yes stop_codon:yes gene_type:complete